MEVVIESDTHLVPTSPVSDGYLVPTSPKKSDTGYPLHQKNLTLGTHFTKKNLTGYPLHQKKSDWVPTSL